MPQKTLPTGATMPAIGLGTFGSDKYGGDDVAQAVIGAAGSATGTSTAPASTATRTPSGRSLQTILQGGVPGRNCGSPPRCGTTNTEQVIESCEQSLRDLQLDYLDLFLVHWPFPNSHGKGVDVSSRDPHAQSYIHENYMRAWGQMEQLVERGLVRHIGTSNMTIPKLKLVLRDATIKPAANEMELHPHFQQPELFRYVVDNDIVPIGYSPIGSPSRPERDRTPDDTVDIEDPVIVKIAQRLNVHPAVVCVKWAAQHGQVPIPFSVKRSQYLSTLQAIVSAPLTDEEMQAIAGIDKNNRLIKGHVFLWKDGQTWEDLWDVNGEITPPSLTARSFEICLPTALFSK